MNDFIRFCVQVIAGSISICALLLSLNHSGWFRYQERNSLNNIYRDWSSNPKFEQAQLVFCGNSQVHYLNDSILRESLEKNVFALSCQGCRFQDHLEALRRKIDNNPPEIIIIETHSLFRDLIRKSHLNHLPTSLMNFLSIESTWERVKYFVRDVIRERSLLEVKPGLLVEAIFRPREREWKNGFKKSQLLQITAAELERYEHNWQPFPDTPVEQCVLDDLRGFLEECALQEVEVVLYESPFFHKHCVPQTLRRRGIQKVAFECNVPFFDLNEMDSLITNHRYFQGTSRVNQHLTDIGAIRVAEVLVRRLSGFEMAD
jgi:hypothetical protein